MKKGTKEIKCRVLAGGDPLSVRIYKVDGVRIKNRRDLPHADAGPDTRDHVIPWQYIFRGVVYLEGLVPLRTQQTMHVSAKWPGWGKVEKELR